MLKEKLKEPKSNASGDLLNHDDEDEEHQIANEQADLANDDRYVDLEQQRASEAAEQSEKNHEEEAEEVEKGLSTKAPSKGVGYVRQRNRQVAPPAPPARRGKAGMLNEDDGGGDTNAPEADLKRPGPSSTPRTTRAQRAKMGQETRGADEAGAVPEVAADMTPGAVSAPGRAFGLRRRLSQMMSPRASLNTKEANNDLPQAVMIDDADVIVKGDEIELLITDATPVVEYWRQKRFWLAFIVLAIIVAVAVYLAVVLAKNDVDPQRAQRVVLLEFYDAFNGPNWINNSGWSDGEESSSTGNFCAWYGVTCTFEGFYAKGLSLAANNVAGDVKEIFQTLSAIESLEELDLVSNEISGNVTDIISVSPQNKTNLINIDLRLNGNIEGDVASEICDVFAEGRTLRVDCSVECECCEHEKL